MDKIKAKQKKIEEQQQAGRNPQPPEGAEGMAAAGGELVTYVALGAHPSLVAWKQNIQLETSATQPPFLRSHEENAFLLSERRVWGGGLMGAAFFICHS